MSRPAVLGLILACAVSLCSSSKILENGYPISWTQTFTQMSALPVKDGTITPDPWHYLHRMSFFRMMIDASDTYMTSMGTNSSDNPLWGLALQLGWLKNSSRFTDPTGESTCGLTSGYAMCISPNSWWGCLSYYTSALPFLSAIEQGLLQPGVQVKMMLPVGATGYCTTHSECAASFPDVMKKWDAFFKFLKGSPESQQPDVEKMDTWRGLFWEAQLASLHSSALCTSRQSHYSYQEASFSNSWLNTVEYIAASHFESNLEKAPIYISTLPSRVLQEGDIPPKIPDLSKEENNLLATFSWMSNVNKLMGGTLVRLWKNVMCSVTTRARGRELTEQLFLEPGFKANTFISIVTDMATSC